MDFQKCVEPTRQVRILKPIEYANVYKLCLPMSKNGPYCKLMKIITAYPCESHEESMYVDIRLYNDGETTGKGILLTPKEYNWVAANIKFVTDTGRIRYPWLAESNVLQTTELRMAPDTKKVMVSQKFQGRYRLIYLNKNDINTITSSQTNTFEKLNRMFEENGEEEVDMKLVEK